MSGFRYRYWLSWKKPETIYYQSRVLRKYFDKTYLMFSLTKVHTFIRYFHILPLFTSDMDHDIYGALRKVWKLLQKRKKSVNEYVHTKVVSVEECENILRNFMMLMAKKAQKYRKHLQTKYLKTRKLRNN